MARKALASFYIIPTRTSGDALRWFSDEEAESQVEYCNLPEITVNY